VLDVFHSLGRPTYHMLGNHCLYNLPRSRLNERWVTAAAVNSQTQHPPLALQLLPLTEATDAPPDAPQVPHEICQLLICSSSCQTS
jgi:hypothetical protein